MPATQAFALVLVCIGGGTAVTPDNATYSGNHSGSYNYGQGQYSGSTNGTVRGTRSQEYAEQVDVELTGNTGRIRLPRITLPPLRGGKDGWFDLRNVSVSDRQIDASAAVNFVTKPRVHIDRRTGIISITGRNGTFVGKCEKVEADAEAAF